MISSNWCSIQDKLGSAAVANNSQWLKATEVFSAPAMCPLKVNCSLCSTSSYHFHSGTQSLFGVLLAPRQREKSSGELLFFFFFFLVWFVLHRKPGEVFIFIFIFIFIGGGVVLATPRGICGLCSTRVQTHAPCIGRAESTIQPTEKSLEGS